MDFKKEENIVAGKEKKTGIRETAVDIENMESVDFKERTEDEQRRAEEMFHDLIVTINERYKNLSDGIRTEYIAHNKEILNSAIELGMRNGFNDKELKMLELAAIWHDACKGDKPTEEVEDISQYMLVAHGKKASQEIPKVLTDELLEKAGFAKEEFDDVRLQVSDAILQHMGPHPGFMTGILKDINEKLKAKGLSELNHPEAKGKISEALLAADMRSLAGTEGRKKVLRIRYDVPFFREQDEKVALEYKRYGIEITPSEAALLSGFDSATQAWDMIKDERNKQWICEALDGSKIAQYEMSGEEGRKVSGEEVLRKQEIFELKKREQILGEVA